MQKIIVVTDSVTDVRVAKRLSSLRSNGYDTHLYIFKRGGNSNNTSVEPHKVIGDISNLPYIKRIKILFKGIKNLIGEYKSETNVIFYLFGFQVASVYRIFGKHPYIYEEADLVHTYFKSTVIKNLFEYLDKKVILGSEISIFTSEGFVQYHFPNRTNLKYAIIPNKLNPEILKLNEIEKRHIYNPENIHFGFVGGVRFESTVFFIEHIVKNYPQHTFHIFGVVDAKYKSRLEDLNKYNNFINHGRFKSPEDLPNIYSSIDFVLSTYDTQYENVRYAEPNKLYESIYFRVPIIVSENTFLSQQVYKYNSGFSVNALSSEEIDNLIEKLSLDEYNKLIDSLNTIEKLDAVDSDFKFITELKNHIK